MEDAILTFLKCARSFIPAGRIMTDDVQTLAWGTDAGFYRLIPKIVIHADNEEEVSSLLKTASRLKVPVTFRAAGTSLSGQAVSDSVLIVAGKRWEKYSISDDASSITLQPGIVGARVNRILSPLGRKFGPDPASIGSCMVGGIVMNNASGMNCGTHANSDATMISARIVLPDGCVLDTGSKASRDSFSASHPDFIKEIEAIRDGIRADKELSERIRYKYSIKNVTGLNIYPFIRFDDPFDIIAHLMAGSEGTLAFLSGITMKTIPIAPYKACAMIYFNDIKEAAQAVVAMKQCGATISAAELLDKRSLTSVGDCTGDTAVLTEISAESQEQLDADASIVRKVLEPFRTVLPVEFTSDAATCSRYWAVRSGIFPTVGGMRRKGTTCLIEDIAFHIEDLPEATADLSNLLDKHGYDDSCIYGHALEGNFHFIINQSFDSDEEVARYEAMIRDVAQMVVEKYDGSLKAEHGTGRNMAPFVSYEWGEKAFSVMKRVKKLFDPDSILNPGVIFNDDPRCYLKNFKALPLIKAGEGASGEAVEAFEKLNKCIECGFCEVNCLSCGLGLSSRTRIVVQREIARLEASGKDMKRLESLMKGYKYPGDKLCAADGLCSMSCPMGISVADLTHEIRRENVSRTAHHIGELAADHFEGAKSAVRGLLDTAALGRKVIGDKAMAAVCKGLHDGLGIPLWTTSTPAGFKYQPAGVTEDERPAVVYFPSCINQTMGATAEAQPRKPLIEETVELLQKAGYRVIFPEGMEKMCCGTIWESKGMPDIADRKTAELEQALRKASLDGQYPILCDQSPCLHRMRLKIHGLKLYEPAEFIWKFLKDRLEFERTDTPVAIHTTCTMRLMGLQDTLYNLASLCSSRVLVPEEVGCCGFAGDKGMTTPELNAYALRKLRAQLEEAGIKEGYSNSRTCEIGLKHNSGIPYVSIVYLVNACTRPICFISL